MRVVLNRCYGGFGLSDEAYEHLQECGDADWRQLSLRSSPELVATVEALGDRASGRHAQLELVDVEPNSLWRITEYDGYESIEYFDINDWCN